jgi:PKD repeat protein
LTVTSSTGCTSEFTGQVTVNEGATAGFSASNVCIGNTVNFINSSGLNATAWSWNFGDGNTSTSQTASHTYTAPGTYTVTLNVQTSNGCISIASNPVTVYALPTIQAGQDQTICIGQSATLTASGGATYIWTPSFVNGQAVSPTQTTTYSVLGTDVNGCENMDEVTVTVVPIPTADFTASEVTAAPGTEIIFSSSSTNASLLSWNFGNGSQITTPDLTDQSQIYLNQGIYTVTLTASNGICTASQNLTITIVIPFLEYFIPNVFSVVEFFKIRGYAFSILYKSPFSGI